MKIYTKCKKLKPLDDFYKYHRVLDGRTAACKECLIKKAVKYHKENIKKASAATLKWQHKNIEKTRSTRKKTYNKRRTSISIRLNDNIRSDIRRSLKGNKCGRHWESLVGYSVEQLKKHLESKFNEEMSWANYGVFWEIDHKIPKIVFNFTTSEDIDFKRCWSLKNLQPLECSKNRSKQAKLMKPFQPALLIGGSE